MKYFLQCFVFTLLASIVILICNIRSLRFYLVAMRSHSTIANQTYSAVAMRTHPYLNETMELELEEKLAYAENNPKVNGCLKKSVVNSGLNLLGFWFRHSATFVSSWVTHNVIFGRWFMDQVFIFAGHNQSISGAGFVRHFRNLPDVGSISPIYCDTSDWQIVR